MTNKSFIGVDSVYYATITTDTSATYTAGTPAALAGAMNISQAPKTNTATQYADNQPFDTFVNEGETVLELELTGVPLSTLAILLGKEYDATNGLLYDGGGTVPDCALGFRAKTSGGYERYYWFLKGKFSAPTEEQSTETDTPAPKSLKLTYTAIRTVHEFDLGTVNDSCKRVVGETSDTNFDETGWFTAVQTPPEIV